MKPQFSITNTILNKVVLISKIIGNLESEIELNLHLRRKNCIKSIHSSLAIESNTLSIKQVTDIIDGKRVLGDPKEIMEVKNAYMVYEKIIDFDPYNTVDFLYAHALLTKDLVNEAGIYRNKDVGIFDSGGNVVHMGARPMFIKELMDELFNWGDFDNTPEIIKSCVFHYEIEVIHPFIDGNGRMGRLWQNVILSRWNTVFRWMPIETIIFEKQKEYYSVLAQADKNGDSTCFIEFMLDIILEVLLKYEYNDQSNNKLKEILSDLEFEQFLILKKYLLKNINISNSEASMLLGKSIPTSRRYLSKFVDLGLIVTTGSNKNRRYFLNTKD